MSVVRSSAIALLLDCAQQHAWRYGCRDMPGYSDKARELAEAALRHTRGPVDGEEWRWGYRAAAELLKLGWKP